MRVASHGHRLDGSKGGCGTVNGIYSFHHMLLFLSFLENEDFSEQS